MPYLVRNGEAEISINLDNPSAYKIWAISTGGRRLENIDAKVAGKTLTFIARVKGPDGARMQYEIATK